MFTVNVYVEAGSAAPRKMRRMTAYVLECTTASGKMRTIEGFQEKEATYHGAILMTLLDAVKRLNQPCELHIHTQDGYIVNSLNNSLKTWAKNGYQLRSGDIVKNRMEWEGLWNYLHEHLFTAETGTHSYYSWMMTEMERKNDFHSRNTE